MKCLQPPGENCCDVLPSEQLPGRCRRLHGWHHQNQGRVGRFPPVPSGFSENPTPRNLEGREWSVMGAYPEPGAPREPLGSSCKSNGAERRRVREASASPQREVDTKVAARGGRHTQQAQPVRSGGIEGGLALGIPGAELQQRGRSERSLTRLEQPRGCFTCWTRGMRFPTGQVTKSSLGSRQRSATYTRLSTGTHLAFLA